MGERAVALCPVADDGTDQNGALWDRYRSQWAGSDGVLSRVLDTGRLPPEVHRSSWWQWQGRCGPDSVPATLDYLSTAAVYGVTPDGLRVAQPLWFGFPLVENSPDSGLGVLAPVNSFVTACRRRRWFRQLKGDLQDDIRSGSRSPQQALGVLFRALCSRLRPRFPLGVACSPSLVARLVEV